jgi:mRNA interferase MazF
MRAELVPGSVFWLNLGDGTGHEQQSRRPVLIVSDARLTALGLALAVPLTTTDRGWDLHVRLTVAGRVTYAMCEQIRAVSIDRLSTSAGAIAYDELADVRSVLRSLIGC